MRTIMVKFLRILLLAGCFTLPWQLARAEQDTLRVIASIKPVHSLVAAVMGDVGQPGIIIDGGGSPHVYSLKPSQAAQIEAADVIFWLGVDVETFLQKPVRTIGEGAVSAVLLDAPGLVRLPSRDDDHGHGEATAHDEKDDHAHNDDDDHHATRGKEAHDDDDQHAARGKEAHDDDDQHAARGKEAHDDDDQHAARGKEVHDDDDQHAARGKEVHDDDDQHAAHGKEAHDDDDQHAAHGKEAHDDDDQHAAHGKEAHDDDDQHAAHMHTGAFNGHVWLDPQNAKALVKEIARVLSRMDPENADNYSKNAHALYDRLDALTDEVRDLLQPIRHAAFIVFHDAYPNFEYRFDLKGAGAITISPEIAPSAERIAQIKERIERLNVRCIFSEPQFRPRIVDTLVQETNANSAVIDPLGASLENGPELYFLLIRQIATSMHDCLSSSGAH